MRPNPFNWFQLSGFALHAGRDRDINGYGYAKLFIYNNLECGSVYERYKRSTRAAGRGRYALWSAGLPQSGYSELLLRIFAARLVERCGAERRLWHTEREFRAGASAGPKHLSVRNDDAFDDAAGRVVDAIVHKLLFPVDVGNVEFHFNHARVQRLYGRDVRLHVYDSFADGIPDAVAGLRRLHAGSDLRAANVWLVGGDGGVRFGIRHARNLTRAERICAESAGSLLFPDRFRSFAPEHRFHILPVPVQPFDAAFRFQND